MTQDQIFPEQWHRIINENKFWSPENDEPQDLIPYLICEQIEDTEIFFA